MATQNKPETTVATSPNPDRPNTDRPNPDRPNDERYDPQRVEKKWFERWQQDPSLYAAEPDSTQEEVLRARNAAVSLGRAAHGTRAQLLHRRRAGPLHVDERLQRASSDGLGLVRLARGECGDSEQHAAARVDAAQHRQHEGADEAPRLRLRLVARSHDLPAGILPLEPVVLPQALRAGIGLSQEEQGELVSEVRDRAGERAGGRRMLLASRRHDRRAARTGAVVPAHHEVRRRIAARSRQARRLAGKSSHHAAQLDRPQRRHAGRFQAGRRCRAGGCDDHRLHHAHRHHLRRDLDAARAGASAGRRFHAPQPAAAANRCSS